MKRVKRMQFKFSQTVTAVFSIIVLFIPSSGGAKQHLPQSESPLGVGFPSSGGAKQHLQQSESALGVGLGMRKFRLQPFKIIGLLLLILLSIPTLTFAQAKTKARTEKADTLAAIREFMRVCNVYKQLPLYVEIDMYNTTGFITGADDTTVVNAQFYITENASYMRFGDMEQLVNDSLALMVSDKLKRMILHANNRPVAAQMQAMMGIQMQDSSLANMAQRYETVIARGAAGIDTIKIKSRIVLYGTSLPQQTIEVIYTGKTKLPAQVTTTKRSLVSISEADQKKLSGQAGMEDKLLNLADKGYFIIKEQTDRFIYKKIEHDLALQIPVSIANRIFRTEEGKYATVKQYESYALTQE